MDWPKVVAKLRATSDQFAQDAQNELLRGNKNTALQKQYLSEIFYGLHASFEAGLSTTHHES